jgi:hypothetical protein
MWSAKHPATAGAGTPAGMPLNNDLRDRIRRETEW